MRIFTRFLLLMVISITILTGYKSDNNKSHYKAGELLVSISLDSVNPGSISQKQVSSVRKVVISSGGKSYLAKSFNFSIVPKAGDAHFFPCDGNIIPERVLFFLRKVKPGDFILVGNIVLFKDIKYKAVLGSTWTVVAG